MQKTCRKMVATAGEIGLALLIAITSLPFVIMLVIADSLLIALVTLWYFVGPVLKWLFWLILVLIIFLGMLYLFAWFGV